MNVVTVGFKGVGCQPVAKCAYSRSASIQSTEGMLISTSTAITVAHKVCRLRQFVARLCKTPCACAPRTNGVESDLCSSPSASF